MKGTAKQALGYGVGAVGKDMVYALVSGFILYYYNDILGISGTFTGVMMMAARVFDAFNDPLMGVVVEKTNTPFGKFRPWIFTGTVTNALILYDQAMVVVVGIVVFNASLYLTTQLAVYFFKYDIGNSDLFSLFGTVGGVGQILSMVSLPLLRRRWGGKQILAGALGVTIAGYLALFALSMAGVRAVAPLAATAFVIYIGFGLATVLTTVFLADTVDYGEYKTGSRNESVVFSMQTFVVKLASAVSVLIAGIGIDLIGLDDTAAVQSESTLLGLRLLMVGLPVLGLVFSILYFMKKYRLTEAETARISEALRQREGSKG